MIDNKFERHSEAKNVQDNELLSAFSVPQILEKPYII